MTTDKNKQKPRRTRKKSKFTEILNHLLKSRGISMKAAAELAGVSPSTISDWTAGATPNDFDAVARLAKALNVSFEYMCLGTSENKPLYEIPIEDIFEEVPTEFEGIFKITAIKLIRRN